MGKHHARQEEDFYKTPPQMTRALLEREVFSFDVHEPACGDGAISEVLYEYGYDVCNSDLYERGYSRDFVQGDFLNLSERPCDTLITNPPYKFANEFFLHANKLGYKQIALLLRLAWLEGEERRQKIFSRWNPHSIHVFSGRQTLWKGDDPNPRTTGGMAAYAWFVWNREDKAFNDAPVVYWISKDETERLKRSVR